VVALCSGDVHEIPLHRRGRESGLSDYLSKCPATSYRVKGRERMSRKHGSTFLNQEYLDRNLTQM
jgi:hypothetical protein